MIKKTFYNYFLGLLWNYDKYLKCHPTKIPLSLLERSDFFDFDGFL